LGDGDGADDYQHFEWRFAVRRGAALSLQPCSIGKPMSLWAVGGFEMKKCYAIGGGKNPESQTYSNTLNTLIDDDDDKVRVVDATPDGGLRIPTKSYYSGRPVVPSTMPEYLVRVGPLEYPLHDLYQVGHALVGTKAFKDAVEAVEPGVHQFFPMKIVETEKSRIPVAEYFWMVICNRLDSLDKAKCTPPLDENAFPDFKTKLVFSEKKIGKAHAWVDKFAPYDRLVSEELHARLLSLNMTGYNFQSFDVAE
jgi:hypothetical protein